MDTLLKQNGFIDYSYQAPVIGQGSYLSLSPALPLARWVQCFWQLDVPSGCYNYLSVPDNNVDCVFAIDNSDDNELVAPFSQATGFALSGPVRYFGIRLRVLASMSWSKVAVGEWQGASFADVFGPFLYEALCEAIKNDKDFSSRCDAVSCVLLDHLITPKIDKRLVNFVRQAHLNTSAKLHLSDDDCTGLGLSARQLRRLSHLYLGLPPKSFYRVMRFQKVQHLMRLNPKALYWGDYYCDQSHYIKEFKALAGVTPGEFVKMSALKSSVL